MESENKISFAKLIFTFFYILLYPALILFLSGDWFWIEGWVFSAWFAVLCFSTIYYLYKNDPALLSERYKKPGAGNQKGWDKFVVYSLAIGFFAWIIIMPLDAKKYSWTPEFPLILKIIGFSALIGSSFFFYRSYKDNTFLSPLVRVQEERKHRVVSTGVYGIVRHPMYFGALLLFIGTPMLLGSVYGILTGIIIQFILVARIYGEEKMLEEELEGYREYKLKVKYRLIPFVW